MPAIVDASIAVLFIVAVGVAQADANPRYAALVVDVNSGEALFEADADALRFPASLTKMMTLYILFEELEAGRLSLDSELTVSEQAAVTPPSKLGVRAGQTIRVEDAILALAVRSANDVSVVIAENLGGTVTAFARRMTRTAEALGMEDTTFANPHGLPDPDQMTTARDMARLGLALHDRFPSFFHFFGTRNWSHGQRSFRNTNGLLGAVRGMDGIKTGFTYDSGYNLVSSVQREGRHILAVVMGGRTGASRNAHMRELIERHLPRAKNGAREAPLLIADTSHVNGTPLPRERPGDHPTVLAAARDAEALEASARAEAQGDEEVVAVGRPAVPLPRPEADALLGYAPSRESASDPLKEIDDLIQHR